MPWILPKIVGTDCECRARKLSQAISSSTAVTMSSTIPWLADRSDVVVAAGVNADGRDHLPRGREGLEGPRGTGLRAPVAYVPRPLATQRQLVGWANFDNLAPDARPARASWYPPRCCWPRPGRPNLRRAHGAQESPRTRSMAYWLQQM